MIKYLENSIRSSDVLWEGSPRKLTYGPRKFHNLKHHGRKRFMNKRIKKVRFKVQWSFTARIDLSEIPF